jgi:hypothetical protein
MKFGRRLQFPGHWAIKTSVLPVMAPPAMVMAPLACCYHLDR